jgi:molecular chaperone GrpE (heat shock protein)
MVTKLQKESIAIRQNKGRDMSPKWDDAVNWTSEQFTRNYYMAMDFYRLEKSNKDLKPVVIHWMSANGYSKKDIADFKRTKDNRCGLTMGSIVACLIRGMPESHPGFNNNNNSVDWLRKQIAIVIEEGKSDIDEEAVTENKKEEKATMPVITIQDRLREAASGMSEELDAAIDSWITDPEAFNPKEFKVVSLLKGKGAKSVHTRFIKSYFTRSHSELTELASGNADEQLREAYKHVSRKNIKKMIDFYDSIMSACEQITAEQKVLKKPRAKKVKPAEQLVAKLKFLIKDDKLGIVSVPPAGLIGAQSAVTYNVKTRKLGVYISKSSAGLNVKGTSFIDFSDKSFQKTLRKPADQIKEFKDQNTAKRVETWFGKIKSVETKLNGRMSADIVILKVFK